MNVLQLGDGYWFASRTRRRTYHVVPRSHGNVEAICGQRFVVGDASFGARIDADQGVTICLPCEVLAKTRGIAQPTQDGRVIRVGQDVEVPLEEVVSEILGRFWTRPSPGDSVDAEGLRDFLLARPVLSEIENPCRPRSRRALEVMAAIRMRHKTSEPRRHNA